MSTKKDKERTIFDLVYSDRVIEAVTPTEEPDFKVKNTDGEFGVEITEFYFSQSQARLRNIPTYFREIIEDRKYRHKDDIVPLEVKEFTVIPHDNRSPNFKVEGLLHKRPDIEEYANKVAEVIENKSKLFGKYINGLNHVNLIIFDYEQILLGTPKNKFHDLFFQPSLEKTLMDTGFREVFFVTRLGEFDAPKTVYIPLKMLFLVAEVFLFDYIMDKEYPDTLVRDSENSLVLAAEYLTWRGAKNISFKNGTDGFEIVYGNSGIIIAKEGNTIIRDYTDFSLPADFNLFTEQKDSHFFDDAFLQSFEKHKNSSAFSMELCFDVSGSKPLSTEKP